jgi:hypothetical protein
MDNLRKRVWKCENCESEALFKGLCRDCTEYGEGGEVLNPVYRVRVNENHHHHNHHAHELPTPLLQGVRGYRTKRKLTKKQLKKLESELSSFAPQEEGQFALMGESEEE